MFAAIAYMTQAGCSWRKLPAAFSGVSRPTVHRRFTEWTRHGLWERLHYQLLTRLNKADGIDWSRAIVDSISVRALKIGDLTGPNPVDRGKLGSKIHILCDRRGIPLTVLISAANTPDALIRTLHRARLVLDLPRVLRGHGVRTAR